MSASASHRSVLCYLYNHNPFYVISAVLMLFAVRSAYGTIEIGSINCWVMMGVLAGYTLLLAGIVAIGVIYTLIGIVLVVRYNAITDFLIPMSGVAVVLQMPFLYFLGWVTHPLFLVIPTSAPTMLMQGAYIPLADWQWLYGIGYTTILIGGLAWWAYRAFQWHIIMKGG